MGAQGLALLLETAGSRPVLHAIHAGAATAAATAAAAAVLLPNPPARCDASASAWYRGVPEPFPAAALEGDDTDRSFVFDKEFHESGTVVSTVADGTGGLSYVKTYPLELKSFWSTFSPFNVLLSAMRSAAINIMPLVQDYMMKVDALEEQAFERGDERPAEWPPLPMADLFLASQRASVMWARDLLTLSVRRIYERIAAAWCSPRRTWKLLKDVRASAIRKLEALPWNQRTLKLARTNFRANALGSLADCTVSTGIDSYRAAARARAQREYKGLTRRLLRIIVANVTRCFTCLLVASVGAGLGALIGGWANRPGAGAYLGGLGAEIGFSLLVISPLLNEWVYRDEIQYHGRGGLNPDGNGNNGDGVDADTDEDPAPAGFGVQNDDTHAGAGMTVG